jgi:hypothetical protein
MTKTPLDFLLDSISWIECPPPEEPSPEGLPYVTHEGVLQLGGYRLRCYVLSSGVRIIDAKDMEALFSPTTPSE